MNPDTIINIYLCFWLAVFGAVLGSFLDRAVSRWIRGECWYKGRSLLIPAAVFWALGNLSR